MDNLTAIQFSRKTKHKLHCIRKGLEMMMNETLQVFNTTESQLPAEFPAEGKFEELNKDMRLIRFEEFFKIHLIVWQKTLIGCLAKMLKGEGVETFYISTLQM